MRWADAGMPRGQGSASGRGGVRRAPVGLGLGLGLGLAARAPVASAAVLGVMILSAGGCATSIEPRTPGSIRASASGSGSADVDGPVGAVGRGHAALAPDELAADGPWSDRRDDALTAGVPSPQLATGQWPAPPRASLDRRVYIWLPRSDHTFLFFREPYPYRRYGSPRYRYDPYR